MITETIITTATTSLIKSIVDNMRPKFDVVLKSAQIWSAEHLNLHEAQFNEYLMRTYQRFSIINTLAFHNSQQQLKDIYVPQTLVKKYAVSIYLIEKFLIDKFPAEMIKRYKKVLITDTAGMGKSTIMKRMFIDLIDTGLEGIGVPIYIELNKLNENHTILSEIKNEINSLSKEFNNDLLLHFLQTGGFVFFMDGYDEIPKKDINKVSQDLQDFITKAGPDNYYIMTSRSEDRLAGFGHFQELNIQPLTKDEAYELLKKYGLSNNKEISTKLIDLLRSGKYKSISEYLENPLLVTLLFIVFDYRQKIPLKKHLFYRQVYDALFETHKEAQGHNPHEKASGLDIDDFSRVLRFMGFECLKLEKVSFEKDVILSIIRKARVFCENLNFNESAFLSDLLLAVPLFTKNGTEFKWVHKSLMEYYAARFIADDANENQDKILTAIYNSEEPSKYDNMLDLYYDIDYKGFSKNITLPICEEFIEFYNNNLVELDIEKDLIDERIGLLFYYNPITATLYHDEEQLFEHQFKYCVYDGDIFQLSEEYKIGLEGDFFCSVISSSEHLILKNAIWFIHNRSLFLNLLIRKNEELFKKPHIPYKNFFMRQNPVDDNLKEYIKEQSDEIISVQTCGSNEFAYMMINDLLARIYSVEDKEFYAYGKYLSFDVDACKKEISCIKKNTNELDITDGI